MLVGLEESAKANGAGCLWGSVSRLETGADDFAIRDCGNFDNQALAQAFFEGAGGPASDPHRLDADGDGVACESLLPEPTPTPPGLYTDLPPIVVPVAMLVPASNHES